MKLMVWQAFEDRRDFRSAGPPCVRNIGTITSDRTEIITDRCSTKRHEGFLPPACARLKRELNDQQSRRSRSMSTESKLGPYDVALYQYFGSAVSVDGYLEIIGGALSWSNGKDQQMAQEIFDEEEVTFYPT